MIDLKILSQWAFTPGRILAAAAILAFTFPAEASLVVLQDGRSLQVRSFRVEGDDAVVELATGGWMHFPAEVVKGVAESTVIDDTARSFTASPMPATHYVAAVPSRGLDESEPVAMDVTTGEPVAPEATVSDYGYGAGAYQAQPGDPGEALEASPQPATDESPAADGGDPYADPSGDADSTP